MVEQLACELKGDLHAGGRDAQHAAGRAYFRFGRVLLLGELVEHVPTAQLFKNPTDPRTADYLTGRFG